MTKFRTGVAIAALMITAPAMASEAQPDYCVNACTGRFCYFGSKQVKCGVAYDGRSCHVDNVPVIKQDSAAICSGQVE
jgi:hypothetical protein